MVAGDEARKQRNRNDKKKRNENCKYVRARHTDARNHTRDDGNTFRRVGDSTQEHVYRTRGDAEKSARRLKHEIIRSGAEHRESRQQEGRAQLQSATALNPVTQAAHVVLGVCRHHARKVVGQFNMPRRTECRFKRAEQLPLAAKLTVAVPALLNVRFEIAQRIAVQLAVEVSSDFFARTVLVVV